MTAGEPLVQFAEVMRQLRAECPWKRAQTHRSLVRYLLEETHEVIEAIESQDPVHLREELGDLLLQVYFHAAIAEEAGAFTLDDVATDVIAKMRRRNPHVFEPDGAELDPTGVNLAWEAAKAAEKSRDHLTDGLPGSLPGLLYALKVVERLEHTGRPVTGRADGELGEQLLALVVQAHHRRTDPEQALREAVRRRLDEN